MKVRSRSSVVFPELGGPTSKREVHGISLVMFAEMGAGIDGNNAGAAATAA